MQTICKKNYLGWPFSGPKILLILKVPSLCGELCHPGTAEDIAANAKTLIFTATLTCGNLVTKAGFSGEEVWPEWRGRNSNLEKTLKRWKGMEPIFRKLPDCWEITSDFKQGDLNSHIAVALPCWRMNITSCLFCMGKLCQPFEAVSPLLGLVFRHILKRKPRWLMSHVCLLCIQRFRYLPWQGTIQFPFPQIPSILLMWKGDNCWDKKVWGIYSIWI